jgi:NTE family protein
MSSYPLNREISVDFSFHSSQAEEPSSMNQKKPPQALVLNAGGSRGAYQAGVLKRVGEIPYLRNEPSPFQIISGASVGALNGAALAAGAGHFEGATSFLYDIWSSLETKTVYRTDPLAHGKTAYQIIRDFGRGKPDLHSRTTGLLDVEPLRQFLLQRMPFEMIQHSIMDRHLYAYAVAATNYYSGKNTIFIQGAANHPIWEKKRRVAVSTKITIDHLMASTSIPIVFAPVRVSTPTGDYYFGDGGLRLVHPFSAPIRLGAQKCFAIGIRCQKTVEARTRAELTFHDADRWHMRSPSFAHIMGVIMNAIFLDHIDSDLEHLRVMNDIIKRVHTERELPLSDPTDTKQSLKVVDPFIMNPSFDIAEIAKQYAKQLPKTVRYIIEALGGTEFGSADLMSYINFDRAYTRDLLNLGYHDAEQHIEEIEAFIRS